jgi:quinol monooxygenase YgiN
MIIVQGFLKVKPEDFAQYKRRIALHAAQVQMLDGCLQYSMSEDPGLPGLVWVSERWRDKAAQAAHLAGDHMGGFNQFLKHMPISSAHIASFEVAGEAQWLMRVGSDKIGPHPS